MIRARGMLRFAGEGMMAKVAKYVAELAGEIFVSVFGWFVGLVFLAGAYGVGAWLADYFGAGDHRDTAGLPPDFCYDGIRTRLERR
jgi:hypothetical protein